MNYEELQWEIDDTLRDLEQVFRIDPEDFPEDIRPHIRNVQQALDLFYESLGNLEAAISEMTSQE